jgi:hypothetical protein
MFLIAGRSGLRGRRTLEERGPNVAVGCNNMVLAWLIRDGSADPLDEEQERDQEEENEGVVWEGGEEKNSEDREEVARSCHGRILEWRGIRG